MSMSPEMRETSQAAKDALVGVIVKDVEMVAAALERIVSGGGPSVHMALGGWLNIVTTGVTGEHVPPGASPDGRFHYIEVTDAATGEKVGLDQTGLPRAHRDAVRMVNLWLNQDQPTFVAMIKAYLREETPEPLCEVMMAVLGLAVAAARHITDEEARRNEEGGEGNDREGS